MNIASILENMEYGLEKPAITVLMNTNHTKEIRIVFKQGQEMKAHKAGSPIVVEIVDGMIDFGIGINRKLLNKGMIIALDANVTHDLQALQNSIVRLTLIKTDTIVGANQADKT